MPSWNGIAGGVCWSYFHGPMTAEAWQSYLDHLGSLVARGYQHVAALTLVRQAESPSAQQRGQLVQFMKDHDAAMQRVSANAQVLDSAMARGALTALNWLFRKPFKEKVFAELDPALAWLQQQDPAVDPAALRADLQRCVPAEQLILS